MIIWINGSINSGKTTVAKLLGDKFEKAAVIEIDELRNFIASTDLSDSIPINLENALLLADNFHKHSYDVIIPYPLSQQNLEYIRTGVLDKGIDIKIFSLAPSLEKVLMNRGERELSNWERDRIMHHYNIGIPRLSESIIIDNSNQTPDETVCEIMSKLSSQEI